MTLEIESFLCSVFVFSRRKMSTNRKSTNKVRNSLGKDETYKGKMKKMIVYKKTTKMSMKKSTSRPNKVQSGGKVKVKSGNKLSKVRQSKTKAIQSPDDIEERSSDQRFKVQVDAEEEGATDDDADEEVATPRQEAEEVSSRSHKISKAVQVIQAPQQPEMKSRGKETMSNRRSLQTVNTLPTNTQGSNGTEEAPDPVAFLATRGYQVDRLLGEGGFAKVYEAHSTSTSSANLQDSSEEGSSYFAIKVFDLTVEANVYWVKNCLKNEMYISKNLKHPNIILTFEVFKTRRNGFIVMDYASRGTMEYDLYKRLKRPYNEGEAKTFFRGLVSGLCYMHSRNIAHRDLKLENFLLSGRKVPMIGDFGFAALGLGLQQADVRLSRLMRRTPCGTPGYMAPEIYFKGSSATTGERYDAKSVDIYALGVSLFEMFNQAKPYSTRKEDSVLQKIIRQDIRWVVELPQVVRKLIESMLQVDPGKRPTIEELDKGQWLSPTLLNVVQTFLGF